MRDPWNGLIEFFSDIEHRDTPEGMVLLCMQKHEETVFGMELKGEHVVRDICQQRITFDDHHLYSPAEDEDEARLGLKCCIFEGLVNNALANISSLRKRRLELETQQQLDDTFEQLPAAPPRGSTGRDRATPPLRRHRPAGGEEDGRDAHVTQHVDRRVSDRGHVEDQSRPEHAGI